MGGKSGSWLSRLWPGLVLVLAVVPAIWHAVDFPEDIDPEFPGVVRPTFSRRPPPAYRLAEPGDTIDRIAIFASAVAVVLAAWGTWRSRGQPGLWPVACAAAWGVFWHASTPGPLSDGWHGLGWRVLFDPQAPLALRVSLALVAGALGGWAAWTAWTVRGRWQELWLRGCARGAAGLLIASVVLLGLRQVEIPGVEPVGYWPRCALVWGIVAFDIALIRLLPRAPLHGRRQLLISGCAGAVAWLLLVAGGDWVTWFHRPLARLKPVVTGKIYISAMPTPRGLEVAQQRHHFQTIINLFPEHTPLRSPYYAAERRFAAEHGIRYVGHPSDDAASDTFLDETLALAQDPAAWPILIHCHGCMDRTPAWMGIYRFVVEGRPLVEALREIERQRGNRPKGSVTLLYNHVLPRRAPARYWSDPTAALLRRCAAGTPDPYEASPQSQAAGANLVPAKRVVPPASAPSPATELDTPTPVARVPLDPSRSAPSLE